MSVESGPFQDKFKEFGSEFSHLLEPNEQDNNTQNQNVKALLDKRKSYREITARIKSMSTSEGADAKDTVDGSAASPFTSIKPETRCTNP